MLRLRVELGNVYRGFSFLDTHKQFLSQFLGTLAVHRPVFTTWANLS